MAGSWSTAPDAAMVVSLDAEAAGLRVRIAGRSVRPAQRTALRTFVYTPRIWGSTLAGLTALVLVSAAFATGAIRPVPPAVPTPRPGEPTPTPDTRPVILIGGFVLQAPVLATPQPVAAGVDGDGQPRTGADADVEVAGADASGGSGAGAAGVGGVAGEVSGAAPLAAPAPACTNLFGIGCPQARPTVPPVPAASALTGGDAQGRGSAEPAGTGDSATLTAVAGGEPVGTAGPAPTAQPGATAGPQATVAPGGVVAPDATPVPGGTAGPVAPAGPVATEPAGPSEPGGSARLPALTGNEVLPAASPGPRPNLSQAPATAIGPPPGSALDEALRMASLANQQFNRSLDPHAGADQPSPADGDGQDTGSAGAAGR